MTSPTTPNTPTSLAQEAERIEQHLARIRSRLDSGSRWTAIIGALLLIVLSVYFYYGYSLIFAVATPEKLGDAFETVVFEQMQPVREQMQTTVDENADAWAEMASDAAINALPLVREYLEASIVAGADQTISHVITLTGDEFRKFIQENRDVLREGFASLQDEQKSEAFLKELQPLLEEQLGTDVKEGADELLANVHHLSARVKEIKDGKELKDEDTLLRTILMKAKALKLASADPAWAAKFAAKAEASADGETLRVVGVNKAALIDDEQPAATESAAKQATESKKEAKDSKPASPAKSEADNKSSEPAKPAKKSKKREATDKSASKEDTKSDSKPAEKKASDSPKPTQKPQAKDEPKPKNDQNAKDESPKKVTENKAKDDKAKDDKAKDDKAKEDKAKEDKAKEDKAKG